MRIIFSIYIMIEILLYYVGIYGFVFTLNNHNIENNTLIQDYERFGYLDIYNKNF